MGPPQPLSSVAIVAGFIPGHVGDPARFPTPERFASYNGTAPLEASSGPRKRHRLNPRGKRKLNHALHLAAVTRARRCWSYMVSARPSAAEEHTERVPVQVEHHQHRAALDPRRPRPARARRSVREGGANVAAGYSIPSQSESATNTPSASPLWT